MNSRRKTIILFSGLELSLFIIVAAIHFGLQLTQPNHYFLLHPAYLFLNLFAIPLYTISIRNIFRWNHTFEKLTDEQKIWLTNRPTSHGNIWRLILSRLIIFFLSLALVQPVLGTKEIKTQGRDSEIFLLVDLSKSMNTADLGKDESRLTVAKRALSDMVNQCKGEKIGIIIFAHNAFLQLPLTKDYSAVKLFINELETSMISQQGTNLNAALELLPAALSKKENTKAVILLTDGENHDPIDPQLLAELKEKITYYAVIALGSENGGPVPIEANRPEYGFITNESGQGVISKVEVNLLRKLTQTFGGTFLWVQNPFPNLSDLLTEINRKSKAKTGDLSIQIDRNLYFVPLLVACLLMLILWSRNIEFRIKK